MILFDRGGDDARDTDAITTHVHRERLAGFVEHGRLHRFAVFATELEDVSDFDAAADRKRSRTCGARVARDDVACIDGCRFGQIAMPVDARVVVIDFIGAAYEVGECKRRMVGINGAAQTDRA